MNEPFGDPRTPYTDYQDRFLYTTCPFCARIVDRRVNYWALYCSSECQRAFRTGLHERVNDLFGRTI